MGGFKPFSDTKSVRIRDTFCSWLHFFAYPGLTRLGWAQVGMEWNEIESELVRC